MSPKRLRISEEPYYSDSLLTLLPDELLGRILSKITDPKTLLVSFLISKRIASILSDSQSLSLQFPTRLTSLSADISSTKSFSELCLQLTNLLRRFNGVQSLRIELPCSCRCPDDIVFKWKAKADVRCGILSFLSTKFLSKIDDENENVKVEKEEEEQQQHLVLPHEVFGPFFYVSGMYLIMLLLISQHPNLDIVELVDSKKHGKLRLSGEELIKLRTAKNLHLIASPAIHKIRYAPKLRLPLSGFEMKEVASVVIRGGVGVREEVEGNVEDALDGGFEDDEHGIFREAMTQMLTRHPSKTFSF